MREDEDQFRHYMPLLRRIVILVAVLTAIPVAMWTVTAFVRTYVGQPNVPSFRPVSVATANVPTVPTPAETTAPATTAALPAAPATNPPTPPMNETKSASSPAENAATPAHVVTNMASPATPPGDAVQNPAFPAAAKTLPVPADSGVTAASSQSAAPTPPAASTAAQSNAPAPPPDAALQFATQPPAPTNWPAPPPVDVAQPATNTAQAVKPIAGPVPLPHRRPPNFILAQNDVIPLPMARPVAARPSAAEAPATPADWLHNIFHSSSGPNAAAPADNATDLDSPH